MLAAALCVAAALPAAAAPKLSFDIGSSSATAVLSLPTTLPMLTLGKGFETDSKQVREPGVLDVFGPSPAQTLTQSEEMSGRHHIRWHYDELWSSGLSSDFPKSSTPSYLLGNDAPGVPQRIWVQFSLTRRF